ncbi:MAG: neutral/alkaline non-lysosomal ceramidase N-terminal domain-containing protein [Myxococcota bacterium]|nr:neutral/alkaline non-lysosomal ceramidase N-terminal domain-containing protein [Myxococcota bacterium]
MTVLRLIIPILLLVACGDKAEPERTPVYLQAGAPLAGVAEVDIDFPIGAPLGGYSNRCEYLGRSGTVDNRRNPYTQAWSSSAGIQTRARAQALWLNNGDQDFVLLKADVIYAYDALVREVERRLEAATGRAMNGRVVVSSSHTHNAPANYSDQYHFYLGGDRYNEEIFQRFVESLVTVALEAFESMEPAAIGMGIRDDWDPDDAVYADRRVENDTLQVWDDRPAGEHKDPRLWVLRVDTAAGEPLGVFYNFAIHGTVLGSDNAMVSTDASGHIEYAVADRFDTPVVVAHLQSSTGDATPRGVDQGYARLESLGELAADSIVDLWSQTPTNTQPIVLESVTHSIPEGLEKIRVTRDGTVDWYYPPYQMGKVIDGEIYNEDGSIRSPLDEFNAEFGGAFCGYDDPLIAAGTIGVNVYPYDGCMQVELVSWVIAGVFGLPADSIPLPLPSSTTAMTSSSRIGPMDILQPDGTVSTDDAFFGFFPGEVTEMFTEQYMRRAAAEVGADNVFTIGYAQDHEGYLLIPEDWLVGGYEANINVWGPLQAEHIMEGNLSMMQTHLRTNLLEPQDPNGEFPDLEYEQRDLPIQVPDETAAAGTAVTALPEDMWVPLEVTVTVQPDPVLARVQGLAQFAWHGGDPAVDLPHVVLERFEDEAWNPVTTFSGRVVTDTLPDIITAHTPDPLYPWDAAQSHVWWAAWQPVSHGGDRVDVPVGTYRLHVYGHVYSGSEDSWPFTKTEYEIASEPFEVVPASITIEPSTGGFMASLRAPEFGYRLIDLEGSSMGHNPVRDAALSWVMADGSIVPSELVGEVGDQRTHFEGAPPSDAVAVEVTDVHGNSGLLELE